MNIHSFLVKIAAAATATAMAAAIVVSAADRKERKKDKDEDGHTLTALWKVQKSLDETDQPAKELEQLEKIISRAESAHLPWDFYDAWQKYVSTSVSMNWKSRDSVVSRMNRSADSFGEPIVNFMIKHSGFRYPDTEELLAFAEKNASSLKHSRNTEFYSYGLSTSLSSLPESIINNISNDYEYILWRIALKPGERGNIDEVLGDYLGGTYPAAAFLEYLQASSIKDKHVRKDALKDFCSRYEGKAVSFFAREKLMDDRLGDLLSDRNARSEDYTAVRDLCKELIKEKQKYSGSEKELLKGCSEAEKTIESLESKDIDISQSNDTLRVLLKNLDDFTLEIYRPGEEKTFFTEKFTDPSNSFFIYDTVRTVIPRLDDGKYRIRCFSDKYEDAASYTQTSVSISRRQDGEQTAVFAADSRTGRPLENADIHIYQKDSLIRTVKGVGFNGYVPTGCSAEENFSIKCTYIDKDGFLHSSPQGRFYGRTSGDYGLSDDILRCIILKDRSVFNPGDTLYFKTLLFSEGGSKTCSQTGPATGLETGFKTVGAGEEVKVILNGPRGAKADSLVTVTGDFGSASGQFVLAHGRTNGRYSIEVFHKGRFIGSETVIVGDIDLPTYDLVFDKNDSLWFPGDSITVSGTVKSYTGHSLSSARLEWEVTRSGKTVCRGNESPDEDGRFSVRFIDKDSQRQDYNGFFNINIRITDITGETLEFKKYISSAPRFYLSSTFENPAKGDVYLPSLPDSYDTYSGRSIYSMEGDVARITYTVMNAGHNELSYPVIGYSVFHGDRLLMTGSAVSGQMESIDFSGHPSGTYRIEAEYAANMKRDGKPDSLIVRRDICEIVRILDSDTVLDGNIESIFKVYDDPSDIVLQIGSTEGEVWAVVEIWGEDVSAPLRSELVYLKGIRGKDGSLKTLRYDYPASYPDKVRISALYFRNDREYRFVSEIERKSAILETPLEFIRFTEDAGPYEEVEISAGGLAYGEYAIAVFDKGTESIMPNVWHSFKGDKYATSASIYSSCGGRFLSGDRLIVRGGGKNAMKAPAFGVQDRVANDMVLDENAVESEEEVPFQLAGSMASDSGLTRDTFRNTLAFIPSVRAGKDGKVSFKFSTSGKISTYYVSVFAHDRQMRNGCLRKEMVVTKPVMVSVSKPRFLNEGDRYALSASLSNKSDEDVNGFAELYIYDGSDYMESSPVLVMSRPVTVKARSAFLESFESEVPEGADTVGFKVRFRPSKAGKGDLSDALFFTVPVMPAEQNLTETHSAVILPGMNRDSVLYELENEFVNTSHYGAEETSVKIIDMIMKAIPEKSSGADRKDLISLSEALYARVLSGCIKGVAAADTLCSKIMEYQNADGGFCWFKGMDSSPLVTAHLLELSADMASRSHCVFPDDAALVRAVKYLDRNFLEGYSGNLNRFSGLSLEQYLYIRSMFPNVGLSLTASKETLSEIREDIKAYLTAPTGSYRFQGRLIDKARRVLTVMNLSLQSGKTAGISDTQVQYADSGHYGSTGHKNTARKKVGLATSLGMKKGLMKKALRAADEDMASLSDYAVSHASGGAYFPNAVMPIKGLLESELYAHSLICDVLDLYGRNNREGQTAKELADDVRIWMMVQKETQQWGDDPAYIRAVASVLDGSDYVKNTEVLILGKRFRKKFEDIKASGNGFSVSRKFFKTGADGTVVPVKEGEVLSAGEKITARYEITSEENRSFVRLCVPRFAALRPVDQVSGCGWWIPEVRSSSHPAYRNVRSDRTIYYFDIFAEGTTVIEEEFFVSQAGIFSSAIPEVECSYAPHYRANERFSGNIEVKTMAK